MSSSNYVKAIPGVLLILGLGFLLGTGGDQSSVVMEFTQPLGAQSQAADGGEMAGVGAPGQEYDRQTLLVGSLRAGAKSGALRGEEIFYMRCWFCHSEYVIVADHFPAPSLRNLYERRDDEGVRRIIRSGSLRMPTYGP